MARLRHIIANMPLRGGLVTAGQRGTVAENQVWLAQNISSRMDGMLQKRPGLKQWGQQLKIKSTDDVGGSLFAHELFADLLHFTIVESSDDFEETVNQGILRVSVRAAATGESTQITRDLVQDEVTASVQDWSIRFGLKLRKAYDLTDAADTGGYFVVRGAGSDVTDTRAFRFDFNAAYYANTSGAWVSLYSDFNSQQINSVEIQVDDDGDCTLYLDDVSVATIAASSVGVDTTGEDLSGTEFFEFEVFGGTVGWNAEVWDVLYRDAVNGTDTVAFEGTRIQAITDYQSILQSGALVRNLLNATKSVIFVDRNLVTRWSPLLPTVAEETTFAPFLDQLIIFNSDGNNKFAISEWDGASDPVLLDDAPPVRFGTEHRTRLWAAGSRKHPLRLYFTASRQSNVWFEPDVDSDETFNEVTNAGFLLIPGRSGDEITSVHGEYRGSLIVGTTRSWLRVVGSGPNSFSVEMLAPKVGTAGPFCVEAIGNDLWGLGNQGVGSLQLSVQYGDLESALPSAPIQDLWEAEPNSGIRLNQDMMKLGGLAYNDALGLMYVAVPQLGESDISAIYVYNANTKNWLGPWTGNTCTIANVTIAQPVLQTVMHGTTDGKIGFPDQTILADFGSGDEYTYKFTSPLLSGRSVDPKHTSLDKTWKILRLFIQPRGDWEFDVTWKTDDGNTDTKTYNQNVYDVSNMTNDFRLSVVPDGYLHSKHTMAMLEITLDASGMWFGFDIETTGAGEEFILQGYEVEYDVSKPVRES